jgi:hypothetical protein
LLSQNMEIKIYRTIILSVFVDMKPGLSPWGRNREWGCSSIGCWGRYLGLGGRKWQETGENCTVGSFMMCTADQILLQWATMRWVGHVACMEMRNTYRVLVEKPEGKRPLCKI